ncbi:MAG: homoserine kinase [Ahniella sp.]|nr:homoserine kinase [Ahniella sp.]
MVQRALAFAPAGVGNVGVGFDILGHALTGVGDRVEARRSDAPGVRVTAITGTVVDLPLDAARNTAGQAVLSLLQAHPQSFGIELTIHKGIPLGSGMGGSAASAVAGLVAANALFDAPLPIESLYPFALDGEAVASGGRHGDNVGPSLIGGLVLATSERLLALPVPAEWFCLLVHPDLVVETRVARERLKAPYAIGEFVRQSECLAQFLCGLYRQDETLVRAGLKDLLVEPRRAELIPGFMAVKQTMLDAGALGSTISGAGPSVFGWFVSRAAAESARDAAVKAFADAGLVAQAYVSPINADGARVEATWNS